MTITKVTVNLTTLTDELGNHLDVTFPEMVSRICFITINDSRINSLQIVT